MNKWFIIKKANIIIICEFIWTHHVYIMYSLEKTRTLELFVWLILYNIILNSLFFRYIILFIRYYVSFPYVKDKSIKNAEIVESPGELKNVKKNWLQLKIAMRKKLFSESSNKMNITAREKSCERKENVLTEKNDFRENCFSGKSLIGGSTSSEN